MCQQCRNAAKITLRVLFTAGATAVLDPNPEKIPPGYTFDPEGAQDMHEILTFIHRTMELYSDRDLTDDETVDAVEAHFKTFDSKRLKQCSQLLYYRRELLAPINRSIVVEMEDRVIKLGDTFAAEYILNDPEGVEIMRDIHDDDKRERAPKFRVVAIGHGARPGGPQGDAPAPDYRH